VAVTAGTQVVRPYRGVSADERRQVRQRALLDACLDVVGANGVHGVTVEAVCAQARLTKRYFYENYPDRDALLAAASDQMMTGIRKAVTAAIETSDGTVAKASAAVNELVDTLTGDPRLARLYVESAAHPVLRERRDIAIDTFTALMLGALFDARRPGMADEQRRLAMRLVIAGTTDLVTSWLAGSLSTDRETLVATIVAVGTSLQAVV
jgi:AcrR family transcriptional regulator